MTNQEQLGVARTRFKKGDRVAMSAKGFQVLQFRPNRTLGTVTGFSRDGVCIAVIKDGNKTAGIYHHTFWRKIEPAESAEGAENDCC